MDETIHQQMAYEANRKSTAATYLLWFFLGPLGAHRFYAGRTKTGFIQLGLFISFIGWLVLAPWLIADLFLIPGIVRDHNMGVLRDMVEDEALEAEQRSGRLPEPTDRRRAEMLEDLRRTGFSRNRLDSSRVDS